MLVHGFIMLNRNLTKWEWYTETNTKTVFLHLLLTANYEDKRWMGLIITRGQRVASYQTLSEELGLSVKCIRTAIKHLKATNEVTSCATSAYSIFTVVHYDQFLNMTSEITDKTQAEGKQQANEGQQCNKANKANNIKKYSEFQNVFVTDEEFEIPRQKFDHYAQGIEMEERPTLQVYSTDAYDIDEIERALERKA